MDTKKIVSLLSFVVIWVGFVGIKFDIISLMFVMMIPVFVFYFSSKLSLLPQKMGFNFLKSTRYAFWLVGEIIKSSISVSRIAWRRNISIFPSIQPIISAQTTELGVVVYANSITLTPGTVTLSTEDNKLLVHALDIKFMEDLQDGTMDKKVLEIIIQ